VIENRFPALAPAASPAPAAPELRNTRYTTAGPI
jgi:hypothetical protein